MAYVAAIFLGREPGHGEFADVDPIARAGSLDVVLQGPVVTRARVREPGPVSRTGREAVRQPLAMTILLQKYDKVRRE